MTRRAQHKKQRSKSPDASRYSRFSKRYRARNVDDSTLSDWDFAANGDALPHLRPSEESQPGFQQQPHVKSCQQSQGQSFQQRQPDGGFQQTASNQQPARQQAHRRRQAVSYPPADASRRYSYPEESGVYANQAQRDALNVRPRSYDDNGANRGRGTSAPNQIPNRSIYIPQTQKAAREKRPMLTGALRTLAVFILIVIIVGGAFIALVNYNLSFGDKQAEVTAALTPVEAGQPMYVLVLGSDERENPDAVNDEHGKAGPRTDVIVLVRLDEENKVMSMLTIPRDTPWVGPDNKIHKLNEAYTFNGVVGTIQAVEGITGVKINHVAETRLSQFEKLIDSIGGITVDVPVKMSFPSTVTGDTITLEPGVQTLNGEQAQIFARSRQTYSGNQDGQRQSAVRTIMKAIITKIKQAPLLELPGVVLSCSNCVDTDFGIIDLFMISRNLREGMTVYNGTGPNEGGVVREANGQWLCYENKAGWNRVMKVMNAGEDIGKVNYEGDVVIVPGTNRKIVID